jgi:radical SAM/Cys-rich protein
MLDFAQHLEQRGCGALLRGPVTTLQVNIGRRCNLACHHCHVESGPTRTEAMGSKGAARVLELLAQNPQVHTLDLTGGAPELNEQFRPLVEGARRLGRHVIDRCNLTVFYEAGYESLPGFLAAQRVEVIASLPCYSAENVDQQRGRGVFHKSIDALRQLNHLGYGRAGSPLQLNLVYNPVGTFLPGSQSELEERYRKELNEGFGIEFNSLYTITNMPIKRFARDLERSGQTGTYMSLLVDHFNSDTVGGLMCRSTLSVDHDGRLFDCDFNQALEIGCRSGGDTIWSLDSLSRLEGRPISTADHCFGCTAGAGSSCGGSLA